MALHDFPHGKINFEGARTGRISPTPPPARDEIEAISAKVNKYLIKQLDKAGISRSDYARGLANSLGLTSPDIKWMGERLSSMQTEHLVNVQRWLVGHGTGTKPPVGYTTQAQRPSEGARDYETVYIAVCMELWDRAKAADKLALQRQKAVIKDFLDVMFEDGVSPMPEHKLHSHDIGGISVVDLDNEEQMRALGDELSKMFGSNIVFREG